MKKPAFIFLFSLFSCGMFAQLTFSPVLAINIAKLKVTPKDFQTSSVLRYSLGVQPVYHFNEKLAIGLGIQLATKGYKGKPGIYNLGEEVKYLFVETNPFLEYRPFKFLGIIAGGNIGYLNSIESKYGGKWNKPSNNFRGEKWNFEVAGGLRYYHGDAFVSVYYSQSIFSILELFFSDENGNPLYTLKEYHQALSLAVGYNFHLKKK